MKIKNFKEIYKNPIVSVLIVPLYYLFFYIYELGALNYYNISPSFYAFDLSRCLSFTYFMFGVVIFIYCALKFWYITYMHISYEFKLFLPVHGIVVTILMLINLLSFFIVAMLLIILLVASKKQIGEVQVAHIIILPILFIILAFVFSQRIYRSDHNKILKKINSDNIITKFSLPTTLSLFSFVLFCYVIYLGGYIDSWENKIIYKINNRTDFYGVMLRNEFIIAKDYSVGEFGKKTKIFYLKDITIEKISKDDLKQ